MLKRILAIGFLILAGLNLSAFAQQKTEILDTRTKAMLLGRHKLSLQWISWDYFGSATVTQRKGTLLLKGKQTGRGNQDYLTVDGVITSVASKEFKFDGKIVVKVSHINGGQPCVRQGEMTFKITGKRKYWRLQEMDNPCDEATDYVDIYFR
jgi:hypothetical protein